MCETMSLTIPCKACKSELKKTKDWDQSEHIIEVDWTWFRKTLFKNLNLTKYRCPQCGWRREADIVGEEGDEWICRCFSATIAGEKFTFCALALLCGNCFHIDYYRPAVEWQCFQIGREFRIYPPINERCVNLIYPMLNVQKERMRQWQLQGRRLQTRLRKRKKD